MSAKSITMVCRNDNPNSIQNARKLSVLLTEKDDTETQTVGTKDGLVTDIVVLTEQEYAAIESHPAHEKVVFIGRSDVARQFIPAIGDKFDRFGIHFGWAGDFAHVYVDDELLDEETYREFLQFAAEKNIKLDDVYAAQEASKLENAPRRTAVTSTAGALACVDVMALPIALPVAAVLIPAGAVGMALANHRDAGMTKHEMKSAILAQQHTVAIELFYLDELADFLA